MVEKEIPHEHRYQALVLMQRPLCFKMKRGFKQAQQLALDFWWFRMQLILQQVPQASAEELRNICLMFLDCNAFKAVGASAKTPLEILAVLQAHVDGLEDEDLHAAINDILPNRSVGYYLSELQQIERKITAARMDDYEELTNLLVDEVMRSANHIVESYQDAFAIPYKADVPAGLRFAILRNAMKRVHKLGDLLVSPNRSGFSRRFTWRREAEKIRKVRNGNEPEEGN